MKSTIYSLLALIFIICSCDTGVRSTDEFESAAIYEGENLEPEEVEISWKRVDMGSLGLSVEFPFKFEETDLTTIMDQTTNDMITSMETFSHEDNSAVYMTNSIKYNDDIALSIIGAVDGSVQGMVNEVAGTLVSRNDEEFEVNGTVGYLTSGTISTLEGVFIFQQLVVVIGQKMYQVIGISLVEDKKSESMIKRFVESVEIKE